MRIDLNPLVPACPCPPCRAIDLHERFPRLLDTFGIAPDLASQSHLPHTQAPMSEPASFALPHSGYTIQRELGRGGMATVYLATDLKHDRDVALKVLLPELSHAVGAERFQREIRLASRLQHPNILPVFDSGTAGDRLWYAMPYVTGESLADRLERERQLPVDEAIRIATEVADALDYAHANGVIHRDVKPGNIMLSSGHALLSDLGIASALDTPQAMKITESGIVVGTPTYMSPEQASGDRIDGRSDLYSLGCVIYEMLSGEPPFTGPTPQAVIAKRMSQTPSSIRVVRPQVTRSVDAVVARALAMAPADRYPTGAALAAALRNAGTNEHGGQPSRRVRIIAACSAVLLIAAAVLGTFRVRAHPNAPAAPDTISIAVLPFRTIGDTTQRYFADGMTEEIATRLANLPDVRVIARTSSGQYRGEEKPTAQIGHELGARFLLSGTVRYAESPTGGREVRVTPRLIDATSGRSVWSHDYDGALERVFDVQSSIAEQVARALDVSLRPSQVALLNRVTTNDTLAYAYYLRGTNYIATAARPEDYQLAASFFSRAVRQDPHYALALAMLSRAHTVMYDRFYDRSAVRLRLAKEAADSALALQPELPEALVALGTYLLVSGDNEGAIRELERAERLQPSDAIVQFRLGTARVAHGDWNAAVRHLRAAVTLDPRSPKTPTYLARLGWTLYYMRRYAEAGDVARQSIDLRPDAIGPHALLAFTQAVGTGDTELARRTMWEGASRARVDDLRELSDAGVWLLAATPASVALVARLTEEPFGSDTGYYYLWKGSFFQSLHDTLRQRAFGDSARVFYEALIRREPRDGLDHRHLALAYALVGRREEAMAAARKGLELFPVKTDAAWGTDGYVVIARVAAMVGDTSALVDALRRALTTTSWVSPNALRNNPVWAAYRDVPAFKQLLAIRPPT